MGLRYDFFPTVTEVHNAMSYFDPNLANPVTGINGALNFTGYGPNTCNCATPVKNYYKNWGPRLGAAYQLGSKTVLRASYGVMFTHGNAVGGLATAKEFGSLGFSAAPTFSSSNDSTTMPGLLAGGTGAIPVYTGATGTASGPAYGTGNTTASGYTGSPSSIGYDDPYLGGRAPEYINWSFGVQRQLTNAMTLTATYVGSEGHFLQTDSLTGRGYYSNQLSPSYLYLGSHLGDTSKSATTPAQDCVTYGLPCPNMTIFNQSSKALSVALQPFPYHTVPDNFGYIGNAFYGGLQALLSMRAWHGLTTSVNYTFSRAIDDGGTFRTGYAIPAGTLANHPTASFKADQIERSVSTSNQPQHFVATAVWTMPFGKSILNNNLERAILGGYRISGVFQAYSGSPLAITESTCQTNPAQSSSNCPAIMNTNFSGSARQNGKWGHGVSSDKNATNAYNKVSFIKPSTGTTTADAAGPFMAPVTGILSSYAYQFSDAPRTAPYNLYGPGNYQLDLAAVRSFPLHFSESAKLNFRAEMYNVTNHTQFAVASSAVGNATFGTVTQSPTYTRKAAQFSARIEF